MTRKSECGLSEWILVIGICLGLVVEGIYFWHRIGMVTNFLVNHQRIVLENHMEIKRNQKAIQEHLDSQDAHMSKQDELMQRISQYLAQELNECRKR